jgi:hypothetical protein
MNLGSGSMSCGIYATISTRRRLIRTTTLGGRGVKATARIGPLTAFGERRSCNILVVD